MLLRVLRLLGVTALLAGVASCSPRTPQPRALSPALPASDVLTQHGNPQRTGAALGEALLTPQAVRSDLFGRLFEWHVDGQIYTQPLYVSQVRLGNRSVNLVLVATTTNHVYAFEAPSAGSVQQPSASPVWQVGNDVLGAPLQYDYFWMPSGLLGYNMRPKIGITATPVIDKTLGTVYLTVKHQPLGQTKGSTAINELVELSLLTGAVLNRQVIQASYINAQGIRRSLDAEHHLQRPSLLEVPQTGRIYLAFGSHQDTAPYHGWIVGYDAKTLTPLPRTYCDTCEKPTERNCRDGCGGIWQAGGGPVADADGNLYVISGNGSFDSSGTDRGTSFIKLDPDLNLMGSWTPATYACLNRTDSDLGSAGPAFLTAAAFGTSVLIGGGKEGVLYALQPPALQGTHVGVIADPTGGAAPCEHQPTAAANGPDYSSVQAAPLWKLTGIMDWIRFLEPEVASQGYHHIHGSPPIWRVKDRAGFEHTLLYLSAERDFLRAYELKDGRLSGSKPGLAPVDTFHSRCPNSDHGMPGGFLTVSAQGDGPDSGIVWAVMPLYNKDALAHVVPGIMRAYRAYPQPGSAVLEELWNSEEGTRVSSECDHARGPGRDALGLFAKFVPPTVADGKVYVSTFSGFLAVYGLKPAAAKAAAPALAPFDAQLSVDASPQPVRAGAPVLISIRAVNTGSQAWMPAGRIELSPQLQPSDADVPLEGAAALTVEKPVAPRQSYEFKFHFTAPAEEGIHYARWRLIRRVGAGQPGGDSFGSPTPELDLTVLRPECDHVRSRATALVARLRALNTVPGETLPLGNSAAAALQSEIDAVKAQARGARCPLDSDLIGAAMPE